MGSPLASFARDYRASLTWRWHPPPAWTGPVTYAHDRLDCCEDYLRQVRKHLEYSMRRRTAAHPLRAQRHIPHANTWLVRAAGQLGIALDGIAGMKKIIELGPDLVDFDAAARVLFEVTERVVAMAAEMEYLSDRVDTRSDEIIRDTAIAAAGGRLVVDLPARPIPSRVFLFFADVGETIRALFNRRQRSTAAAPEDAPRKLSRGRAPPVPALCTL